MGTYLQSHSENYLPRTTKILNLDEESRKGQRNALIVQGGCSYLFTKLPNATAEDAQATASCLRRFLPAFQKPGRVHADISREFIKACQDLQWTHVKNTPHRSDTNKITEGAVPRVKEGTPSARVPSGLLEEWWGCAMECYGYVRNVRDKRADDKDSIRQQLWCFF